MRQVRVIHQPELFEQLKGPVDGGDVDAGGTLTDRVVHRLGRRMTEIMHRFEDQLTLWGEPQTPLAEHGG
ncbi:hypothetical protein GCM10009828_025610 [Actinoplanes couchii]|uniref:Uncharacterized protein n=1 Tax=Actinoplanes couchii TaxID=403638 RepID=A0ABQ3XAB8_9ACTN|nr:hypothetical protein Aco03nite_038610 [Actinoplanes couchii]